MNRDESIGPEDILDFWFEGVADDPQAAELMVELKDELTGPQRQLGGLFEMSKSAVGPAGPAPVLGRHTDEILRERLGYDGARIAALRAEGVIR